VGDTASPTPYFMEDTLHVVEYEGFQALVLKLIDGINEVDGALLVELATDTTSTRAVTAALISRDTRKRASGIKFKTQLGNLNLERFAKYRVLTTKADKRRGRTKTMRTVVIHEALTAQKVDRDVLYFLTPYGHPADKPPNGFYRRLRMAVQLPMFPSWEQWLWNEGREQVRFFYRSENSNQAATLSDEPIKDLSGKADGLNLWAVKSLQEIWLAIYRRHFDLNIPMVKVTTTMWRQEDDPDGWQIIKDDVYWYVYHKGEKQLRVAKTGDRKSMIVFENDKAMFPVGGFHESSAIASAAVDCGIGLDLKD